MRVSKARGTSSMHELSLGHIQIAVAARDHARFVVQQIKAEFEF